MINWNSVKTAAEGQPAEKPWNPVGGFDINGDIKPGSPIDHEKAFGRAMKYGLLSGGGTWFIHSLISKLLERKKKRTPEERIKAAKRRLAWSLGIGAAGAAYGYGDSVVEDAIKGTHFNYQGYRPKEVGDYNIVVAGAGSGAHEPWYKNTYDQYFGAGKYVMFNPNDDKDMRRFVDEIPDGSRIRIWGHSRGGKPAYDLAQYAAMSGKNVDHLHTVDIVGKPWNDRPHPKLKDKWTNWVIMDRPDMKPSKLMGVKDFLTTGGMDGDLVATMGGVTGPLNGTDDNRVITDPRARNHGDSIFHVIGRTKG